MVSVLQFVRCFAATVAGVSFICDAYIRLLFLVLPVFALSVARLLAACRLLPLLGDTLRRLPLLRVSMAVQRLPLRIRV